MDALNKMKLGKRFLILTVLLIIVQETVVSLTAQQELAASTWCSIVIGSLVLLLGIGLVYFIMSRALSYMPKVVAEKQNAVVEGTKRNIVRISDMVAQNASGAEQTSQAGQELARKASDLQQLLAQFRMKREAV